MSKELENDIPAIKTALDTTKKAGNIDPKTKKAQVDALEAQLGAHCDKITKGVMATEHEEALTLVKTSNFSPDEKERMLKSLDGIYADEYARRLEAENARIVAIRKAVQNDPSFVAIAKAVRSTGQLYKSEKISDKQAHAFISDIIYTMGSDY